MSSEQSSVRSVAGPIWFTLIVQRPDERGAETGEVITFFVNAMAVPRVGEELSMSAHTPELPGDIRKP